MTRKTLHVTGLQGNYFMETTNELTFMDGLKITKSDFSVAESAKRMVAQIEKEGWHLFTHIDHAKEAKLKGLPLRPTELILFGNPEIGTLLMQDQQISAIDLPMKLLVWEDEAGQVYIAYNNLAWLKKRHGLKDNETMDKITLVIEHICKAGSTNTTENELKDEAKSNFVPPATNQKETTTLSSPVCFGNSPEVREDFRDE
ncbi:MAG: DUF302 domain-containing protein [Lentimicrobium sp.]|jgi:uncharacterized protein (DUF302 family)|nr:DUF302 domain-containing protein [Lentimicrobium sp.]